jgi:hypothetical protein
MMRALFMGTILALALATAALAQGYQYQPSGLEWNPTTPVQAGETVQGLLRLPTGLTGLGDVYVEGIVEDDMFAYWAGTHGGTEYYYDIYSGYWKPGPVSYRHAALNFQGDNLEGWVRQFGSFVDYDHFFGADGVLYKRINITRNRHRNTNRRREVVYSYFVNMQTGERSDSEALAYRVIGDAGVAKQVIDDQIAKQEAALAQIVEQNPAFPEWQVEAFTAPAEVVEPNPSVVQGNPSLMELIEGEVGPLDVGQADPHASSK